MILHDALLLLKDRVADKAVGGQVFLLDLLLLFLVGGVALEPGQRGDHPEKKEKLGVFLDFGLNENGGKLRIEPRAQPVHNHFPGVLLDFLGVCVVRGERVPVGDKEKAFVLLLELHPVFEGAVKVAQVKAPRRTHPA